MSTYKKYDKHVVISCGPIPARLDSVKFITNRFKGGLAFETAKRLFDSKHEITMVVWEHTELPAWVKDAPCRVESLDDKVRFHVVKVKDVFEYYEWFSENAINYDAFVMAAAVANLTPSEPYEGKFPSHNYKVGEKFDIKFEIAPRAIDIVKRKNPCACLIGYKLFDAQTDEELIEIARHTQKDSKANIIFANTPSGAKSRKIAVFADNSTKVCTFDEHVDMIISMIHQQYFNTKVDDLSSLEEEAVKQATAIVEMFEKTFKNGFGTVAVFLPTLKEGSFVTTARGHNGSPVLVREVDFENRVVYASGKATLNAPTLAMALKYRDKNNSLGSIVVHRHFDDPNFVDDSINHVQADIYGTFPGTLGECLALESAMSQYAPKDRDIYSPVRVALGSHGDLTIFPIQTVDWQEYYETFPSKYFGIPSLMEDIIQSYVGKETLEIGCNSKACTKYAYDKFIIAENAMNLTIGQIFDKDFDLIVAKNSINYFSEDEIKVFLARTKCFVANTFYEVPYRKITDNEVAVYVEGGYISHYLRFPNDAIVHHSFYGYSPDFWEKLGFKVYRYGKNSAILYYKKPDSIWSSNSKELREMLESSNTKEE